ncbi:MAG: hypothetical protein CMM60_03055 [Rhodospirillaceae bacterium]|jgi:D-glycero-alpha-D-manno-heptose-7-phosphate kinase|nr:hypothetical protein [Rhodospirillaceae bacterium]
MIISRTPLRVSFFGGGTDLRSFFSQRPGSVISTGIDRYLYVVLREQVGFVEHKYRINWSQVEFCSDINEIQHPVVREAFRMFKIDSPLELTTFSDIPAGTGLGSSSTFAVGLVNALYALKHQRVTKHTLATEAAHLEIDVLGRVMGKQDHFAASYGKLSTYVFNQDETVEVRQVFSESSRLKMLEERLLLFYTGQQRNASEILESQDCATPSTIDLLTRMQEFVQPMADILSGSGEVSDIGPMLAESWMLKRSLASDVSSVLIDEYYERGIAAGAAGGKILGAGGGGFLLFYVESDHQSAVIDELAPLPFLRSRFATDGSRITYYEPSRLS